MSEDNKLQTFGMNQSEFGRALVEAAQNKEKQRLIENATQQVASLMQDIDTITARMERDKKNLEICRKRIAAIEAGEFKFDYQMKNIIYNDESIRNNA